MLGRFNLPLKLVADPVSSKIILREKFIQETNALWENILLCSFLSSLIWIYQDGRSKYILCCINPGYFWEKTDLFNEDTHNFWSWPRNCSNYKPNELLKMKLLNKNEGRSKSGSEIYEKVHRRKLGIGIRNWTNKCKYCDKGFFQSQKVQKGMRWLILGKTMGENIITWMNVPSVQEAIQIWSFFPWLKIYEKVHRIKLTLKIRNSKLNQ